MVASHAFAVILWLMNVMAGGASDIRFNATDDDDELNHRRDPDLPQWDASELNDLCDGAGYAIYDHGVYTNGTASCDEPESYCCYAEPETNLIYSDNDDGDDNNNNNSTNSNMTTIQSNPCDGFTGIICHGTAENNINCKGQDACTNSTIGLVKAGSCQGKEACKDANITTSVSTNSCIGEKACSEASIGVVESSSCKGATACHRSRIGTVTDNSCLAAREACFEGTIDYVSQSSCQQFKSCSASFLGTILGSSCRGDYACGAQYLDPITTVLDYVDESSCVGAHACHRATIKEAVGGSCIGDYPCASYYGLSTHIESVRNRSCIGYYTCMDATMEIVEDQSCVGRDACRQSMIGNLTNQSCFGDRSCQRAIITSASQSCFGNSTCQNFFVNGTLSNSCQDPWMCASQGQTGDFEDVCRGSLEIPFGPPCSRSASSVRYGRAFVMIIGVFSLKLLFG
ncbi:unnamed protein product [Cylindrotheca closterium]|uniref:DUF7640 domain-containing protein n=1 Tax=Cylindrotheca closterium TaxID=2856 RepID=A0AAD2FRD4_9STRA|nr:unnamed protein product [Cylindrotheca closterium]